MPEPYRPFRGTRAKHESEHAKHRGAASPHISIRKALRCCCRFAYPNQPMRPTAGASGPVFPVLPARRTPNSKSFPRL